MKTKITLLLLTALNINGFSQERMNKVSVNPVQLFGFNIVNFEYERGFKDGKLGVSFFYGRTGNTTREVGGISTFATEQNVSIKSYSKSITESSFWYGGQLSVTSANASSINGAARGIGTLGLTGKLGYQFILSSFYLDFFGGLGYALTNDLFGTAEYLGDITEANVLAILGLKTGIAF